MLVLAAVLMESISKGGAAVGTGGGAGRGGVAGSAMGLKDSIALGQVFSTLHAQRAASPGEGFPMPSDRSRDTGMNTSANFWSLIIAQTNIPASMLVSAMDDGWVEEYEYYRKSAYDPSNGIFWDPGFSADLHDMSNVSYAHVPLHGRRKDHWTKMKMQSSFPLLGHRGPEDGVETDDSMTCPDGTWQGAVVFGDGHVETLKGVQSFGHGRDNLFMLEEDGGSDAILGFTQIMYSDGPKLQWD
jgi:hypothetical protein